MNARLSKRPKQLARCLAGLASAVALACVLLGASTPNISFGPTHEPTQSERHPMVWLGDWELADIICKDDPDCPFAPFVWGLSGTAQPVSLGAPWFQIRLSDAISQRGGAPPEERPALPQPRQRASDSR